MPGEMEQPDEIPIAGAWDAGHMGCGEILMLLRRRMQALSPGEIFKLTAHDPGAPVDMPAWCRLTGRRLLRADHPEYWIEQSRA